MRFSRKNSKNCRHRGRAARRERRAASEAGRGRKRARTCGLFWSPHISSSATARRASTTSSLFRSACFSSVCSRLRWNATGVPSQPRPLDTHEVRPPASPMTCPDRAGARVGQARCPHAPRHRCPVRMGSALAFGASRALRNVSVNIITHWSSCSVNLACSRPFIVAGQRVEPPPCHALPRPEPHRACRPRRTPLSLESDARRVSTVSLRPSLC